MSPTVRTWQVRRLGCGATLALPVSLSGWGRVAPKAELSVTLGAACVCVWVCSRARFPSHLYVWTQTQSLLVQTVSTSCSCPLTRQMTCTCVRARPLLSLLPFTCTFHISERERDNKPPCTLAASAFVCVSFFTRTFKRSSTLVCESFTFNLALLLFVRSFSRGSIVQNFVPPVAVFLGAQSVWH